MRVISKPVKVSGLRVAVAVLCALLVVFTGMLQVAHAHADSATNHADCSLCVAAHITVHMAQSPVPAPFVQVLTPIEAAPVCARISSVSAFALFTRPPPVPVDAA